MMDLIIMYYTIYYIIKILLYIDQKKYNYFRLINIGRI